MALTEKETAISRANECRIQTQNSFLVKKNSHNGKETNKKHKRRLNLACPSNFIHDYLSNDYNPLCILFNLTSRRLDVEPICSVNVLYQKFRLPLNYLISNVEILKIRILRKKVHLIYHFKAS